MQFRVVIPDHVKSGQYIRIHCPDGTEAEMRVPKGLKAGDSFVFDVSEKDNSITIANDVQSLNQQQQQNANNNNAGSGNKHGATILKKPNKELRKELLSKTSNSSSNSTTNNNSNNSSNFLDREVLHVRDFLVALSIGLWIGISIVVGFLAGILYATRGIVEAQYPYQPQQQQQAPDFASTTAAIPSTNLVYHLHRPTPPGQSATQYHSSHPHQAYVPLEQKHLLHIVPMNNQ